MTIIVGAFSRRIVDWKAATGMTTDLVFDTLERAIWTRRQPAVTDLFVLVHRTAAGSLKTSVSPSLNDSLSKASPHRLDQWRAGGCRRRPIWNCSTPASRKVQNAEKHFQAGRIACEGNAIHDISSSNCQPGRNNITEWARYMRISTRRLGISCLRSWTAISPKTN